MYKYFLIKNQNTSINPNLAFSLLDSCIYVNFLELTSENQYLQKAEGNFTPAEQRQISWALETVQQSVHMMKSSNMNILSLLSKYKFTFQNNKSKLKQS